MNHQPASVPLANVPTPPIPLTPEEIRAWLDYALTGLADRRTEILAGLQAVIDAYPTIEDDAAMGTAAENRRMAETLGKTADTRREEHKRPFLEGGRAVDAYFKSFAAPIAAPLALVRTRMDDYGRRKLARERAAADAAAAAAKIEADKAAAQAAAEIASGAAESVIDASLDQATIVARYADQRAAKAQGTAASLTRVTGDLGATTSMATIWKYRVTDLDKLPDEYWIVDDERIRGVIKAAAKAPDGAPLLTIPGVEIYPEHVSRVR